jgi:hypothetical protein
MENDESCEICLHVISNPICIDCYLKHAKLWLQDFGLNEKQIERVMEKIQEKLPKETLNEHECIICGKQKVGVCIYCAFLRTSSILLKLNAPTKAVEAYLESANFEREEDWIER